jgi:hypothetical protein
MGGAMSGSDSVSSYFWDGVTVAICHWFVVIFNGFWVLAM